jgi:hypothetical protein
MPDEHRVTIRLSPELYAQLEACGRQDGRDRRSLHKPWSICW